MDVYLFPCVLARGRATSACVIFRVCVLVCVQVLLLRRRGWPGCVCPLALLFVCGHALLLMLAFA